MRKLNLALLTTVAVVGVTTAANAQMPSPLQSSFAVPFFTSPNNLQILYAGGATLPSLVYRQIFDCFGFQVQPATAGQVAIPINPSCPLATGNLTDETGVLTGAIGTTPTGAAGMAGSGAPTLIMYAGLGSGAGKGSLTTHVWQGSPANAPAFNTTNPVTVTWSTVAPVGYGTGNGPDFVGSDDVLNLGDVHAYAGATALPPYKGQFGDLFSFPALVVPVTIAYNPSGLTVAAGSACGPAGNAVCGLNLSRRSVCGIFSGHINNWNDPSITGDNGAAVSAGQQITVVHRTDGSGTTFLTTNALVQQCRDQIGQDAATGNAVSYAFPWTDRAASYATAETFLDPTNAATEYTKTGQCNPQGAGPFTSSGLPIHGANLINWPQLPASGAIPANSDQCGVAVTAPTGSVFAQPAGTGNSNVQALVQATTGAVSYLSPDFTGLVIPTLAAGGLPVAKVQNQFHVDNPDTTLVNNFVAPLAANAVTAMSSASADFSKVQLSIFNPLNWATQGVQANPTGQTSYPISGFTWLDFYQCYSAPKILNIVSFLAWYYTNSAANGNFGAYPATRPGILQTQDFAPIPASWQTAVIDAILGTDPFTNAGTAFGMVNNASTCPAVGE